jgi:hypothetical protein
MKFGINLVWIIGSAISTQSLIGVIPSFLAQQPALGQSLLIHEISRSHTTTHHSR